MKKNKVLSREVNRISRRDNLPLLRGMFVSPGTVERKDKPIQRNAIFSSTSDDGLVLTADKGYYLGE